MIKVFAIKSPPKIDENQKTEPNLLQELCDLLIQNQHKPIWECIDDFWNFFKLTIPKPIFPTLKYGYDDPLLRNYVGVVINILTKEIHHLYDQNPQLHYYGKKIDFDFCHIRQYPYVLVYSKNKKLRIAFQKCLPYEKE